MKPTPRRILSAWLPNWPITRLTKSGFGAPPGEGVSEPVVTAETVQGRRQIASAGPDGAARGLRPGQTLADALALCPGLIAAEADPAGDAAALTALAAWAERYTPMAAADLPDGLWLDITGAAHLFGGEAALVEDLFGRLTRARIPCRITVAGTPGAAWALARSLLGHDRVVLRPDGERAAMALLPVAGLRLDARTVAGLRRVGLRTVGELARLPRSDITARFGPAPVLRLDQAFGTATEAIAWPRPGVEWGERLALAEPIATPEDLARALALLAGRLCARMEAGDVGAHRIRARFHRVDETVQQLAVATALPVRDAAYLTRLMTERLDTIDPGFGVEVLCVDAEETAPVQAANRSIGDLAAEPRERLAAVVDTLANRLGQDRVWRVIPRASHVPERAVRRAAPMTDTEKWVADPASPRPIRLLRRPEPIEATALVPDDAPIQFRWRGCLHRVRAATGPERIAAEWWRAAPPEDGDEVDRIRDYYAVEDSDGGRFWVFRRGLLGQTEWFLHGLFA